MKVVVVAESHKGSHYSAIENLKREGVEIELLSLQGDRGIRFTNKGYSVSYKLKQYLKSFDAVILGTDIDFQGTKIASILYHQLDNVKKIRLGFSEKGYVKIGGVFSKRRLGMCLALDRKNIIFASKIRKRFNLPGLGLGKALIIKAVDFLIKLGKKTVKVLNRSGSSTITAIVKGWIKGKSPERVMKELNTMYEKGIIDYPRVDADYITQNPYDIYPHKPFPKEIDLATDDFDVDLLKPIEKEKLALNKQTVLLELSNRRLLTPASALSAYKTVSTFFTPSLKRKRDYEEVIEFIIRNLSEEEEKSYIELLKSIYFPQLVLSPRFKLNKKNLQTLLDLKVNWEEDTHSVLFENIELEFEQDEQEQDNISTSFAKPKNRFRI